MEAQQFAGKDGFVWFTGIVEGRQDPAMVGRVRVRIIGWHDDNKNLVPTESLPWAQILMPVSGQRTFSIPKEGEWVMGFFQDGLNGQMPVIMGIYPGIIPNKTTTYLNQKGFGISVPSTQSSSSPTTPAGVKGDEPGKPTTPALAREQVDGTIVDKMNKLVIMNCDFKFEVQKNIKLKQYIKAISDKIREAIRWIVKTLGLTDITGNFSWAINTMKTYARALNYIRKKILKPIQDFTKYVLSYIVLVREMIQWILSLPEKLLQLLQNCLNRLLKAVSSVFTDIVSGAGAGETGFDSSGWQEVVSAAKEAADASEGLLNDTLNTAAGLISIPVAATAGILDPVSESDVAEANKYIAEYENSDENKIKSPNEGKTAP